MPGPGRAHAPYSIAAVVPALNEEESLPDTLSRLTRGGFDVIVVDGGSTDRTVAVARPLAQEVIISPRGRARQMNAGGALAINKGAQILFFLHADSHPPDNAQRLILQALSRSQAAAGTFFLRIDSTDPRLRLIQGLANFRTRLFKIPYGDQGLFLKTSTFEAVGGFPDISLMEDLDMVRRLKKLGRIVLAPAFMSTSPRRYLERGPLMNTLRNQRRQIRYYLGTPPEKLADDYPDVR